MGVGTDTPGAVRQLLFVVGNVLEQLGAVVGRYAGVHHQRHGGRGDMRHQREVSLGVVGQLFVQKLVGHERVAQGQHEGIAIGRGLGHGVGAQNAGGAAPVVDEHGLAEPGAELLADQPRDDVGSTARIEWNDQFDWFCGVGLCPHAGGHQSRGAGAQCQQVPAVQGVSRGQVPRDMVQVGHVVSGCL